ncbi:AsmA family protein [Aliirhizobium terrae]|uniref:AsmA family protein n=1 Tax=Terrirhizobium terrae TaxID=2926709 RepID=UPI00257749EB|nr:AsmA family protein [Rhizobium sp. CC-CFT758]WJH40268.1 AsmA family protein [Rhizobium sp. CC-CFT758]
MLAIGGAVVLVLFTALLAPFFVEWSSFRVEFEQQASRLLGKKVAVHGEVDARILPFPSVTLHDVRIGQDLDGQPQVQVARFSMDMELAPFLSGEARIFDMRIEEPKARLRILKDGTLDWMRGSRPSIPTRVVVIEDVHVVGGEVAIIDEQSGRSRSITGLTAAMSAASLAGPWRGEGMRCSTARQPGSASIPARRMSRPGGFRCACGCGRMPSRWRSISTANWRFPKACRPIAAGLPLMSCRRRMRASR